MRAKFLLIILLGFTSVMTHGLDKKELTIALNAEFETINPIVNSVMVSIYIQDATLRPLVALDLDGKPRAILIKEIPSLENKKAVLFKKGMKAAIEILPEAQWGDGTPLTCDDLKATWQIGKDNSVSTPARENYLNIEDIVIDGKDHKKCEIIFKNAKWDFYLNFPRPLPAHLEMKVFQEHKNQPQSYERNSLYVKAITNPGLYNGPYRVSELKLGSHIILVANEKYFGKKPYFKRIIFKFILNSATMESNLLAGQVDVISSSGFSFDQALIFEKKVKEKNLPYEVLFVPGVIYTHLDLNLENPILSDLRVRKALNFAINRQEIVNAFFAGRQKQAFHFSSPFDNWYTEDSKEFSFAKYSKAKASKLLDEAGWNRQSDGYRYKNGKKLSLVISGAADLKLNEMLQSYIQAAWKQIGVELTVKNYPARVLFSEILRKRNFEIGLYSWVSSPNASLRQVLHSEMIPSEKNSWSGSNRPGWKNQKVDEWLDQFELEFSEKQRTLLMKKVLQAYTEELPALPLYHRGNTSVVPKGLKNYKISGHSSSEYLEIENWSY